MGTFEITMSTLLPICHRGVVTNDYFIPQTDICAPLMQPDQISRFCFCIYVIKGDLFIRTMPKKNSHSILTLK